MAKQVINTGTSPNDGLGDSLLAGGVKINSNFTEIYNSIGDGTTLGIASLTQVNVSGASTFAGITTVTGETLFVKQLDISGVSTFNNTINVIPTSTGVAGIFSGTTSADLVRITQLGTGNALVVEDSANPDTTSFVVNTSGSVGVGSTLPAVSLDIVGNIRSTVGIISARNSLIQDAISLVGRSGGTSGFNLSLTPTTLTASRTVTFQDVTGTVYVSGGTDVSLSDGGTNASLTASNGGIVYSTASAMAILSGTATAGQILRSGASGAPSWSTATFPNTATSTGTILRADGTNWVATTATYPTTTTINRILYSSAANTIGEISSANTSALVTNSSGVPSFTSGTTANRVLRTDGTTVSFAQVTLTSDVTGTLPIANGGTNSTSTPTNGGISYGTGTAFAFTSAGTSGQILQSAGASAPVWSSSLNLTGQSTFLVGPVLISNTGTATTTGTSAQPLQVTGGAYVSGNTGIGSTNPTESLSVLGKIQIHQDAGSNNRLIFRAKSGNSYRWNIDNDNTNLFRIFREDDATSANGSVGLQIDPAGNTLIAGITTTTLGSSSTPPSNSQMSFALTSNTNLRITVRGTDGVLRTANITLA